MPNLIAFDPGGTTGVCIARVDRHWNLERVRTFEIPWDTRFTDLAVFWSADIRYDKIIVEDFRLYAHAARSQINSRFPSSIMIGHIERCAWNAGYDPTAIIYQMASTISNVKLLPQVVDMCGTSEHMKDAFKHLRFYCVKRKQNNA